MWNLDWARDWRQRRHSGNKGAALEADKEVGCAEAVGLRMQRVPFDSTWRCSCRDGGRGGASL